MSDSAASALMASSYVLSNSFRKISANRTPAFGNFSPNSAMKTSPGDSSKLGSASASTVVGAFLSSASSSVIGKH